jgi:hypothetical protein
MPHDHTAAIIAAIDDFNPTGAPVPPAVLEPLVLAMIGLVARSTLDLDAGLAELLR